MGEHGYFQKALADFTYEAASGGAIRHLADMGYTVKQIAAKLDFPTPYERVQKGVWERLLETGVILTEEPGGGRNCRRDILQGDEFARKERIEYRAEFPQKEGSGRQEDSEQKKGRVYKEEQLQKEAGLWREDYTQKRREPVKKAKYVREYDQYGKASFRRVEEVQEEEIVIYWKEYHWQAGGQGVDKLFALLRENRQKNGENKSYMSCDFGLTSWREPEKFHAMLEVLQERQREYITGLPWERCRLYHRLDSRMMEILLRLCEAGMYQGECLFLETKDRMIISTENI